MSKPEGIRPRTPGMWLLTDKRWPGDELCRWAFLEAAHDAVQVTAWNGVCDARYTTLGSMDTQELPTGNWRRLTAEPAVEANRDQAIAEFTKWLSKYHPDVKNEVTLKAAEVFGGATPSPEVIEGKGQVVTAEQAGWWIEEDGSPDSIGKAEGAGFIMRPAFVAPEKPEYESVVTFVECTDTEYDYLRLYWIDVHKLIKEENWVEGNRGHVLSVGEFAGFPVNITTRLVTINGARVCFYSDCSMVVHHDKVKEFVAALNPKANHCNAMNFHNADIPR